MNNLNDIDIKTKITELIKEFNDLSIEERKVVNELLAKLSHISTYNAEESKGTTIEAIEDYENVKNVEKLLEIKQDPPKVLFKNYDNIFLFLEKQLKKTSQQLTVDIIKTAYKIGKFDFTFNTRVFRTSQVSVSGSKTKFMKPEFIESHMLNFISWFNNPYKKLTLLDNSFLLHHYFEIVHPFIDGNGRLGRVLLMFFWISNDLWPKKVHPLLNYVVKLNKSYYLTILQDFFKTDMQREKFNISIQKAGYGFNYLSFSETAKITYDSYLKGMLFFYKLSITETNKFIQEYKKQKKVLLNKLKALANSSKFRLFKNKKISLEKLTALCFSGLFNSYHDIAKKMHIDVRILKKIVKETNLFIDVNLTNTKIVGRKVKNFVNKKIHNYFEKVKN